MSVSFRLKKYERYYGPGRRLLPYLFYYMFMVSPACRLCINIHNYTPLCIVQRPAAGCYAIVLHGTTVLPRHRSTIFLRYQ